MSTNYYWIFDEPKPQFIQLPTGEYIQCLDTDVPYAGTHVGKRYAGNTQRAFIFATDPTTVLKCLESKRLSHPDEKIIEDEYGRQFTAEEFHFILYDCARWEVHAIGEVFS